MQNVAEINGQIQIEQSSQQAQAETRNWDTIFFVAAFHVLAIGAFFTFSWTNLAVFLVLWWVAGSLGIGLSFHRQLTHQGFKTPKWVEYTLAFFGVLALQSSQIKWVATHRIHHAFTDTDKDPHSPIEGNYWAHIGWIFKGTSQEQPPEVLQKYVPDLLKDRVHVVMSRFYWVPTVFLAVALFFIGGWGMVFWGIFLRIVWGWHSTWFVNSITHTWGSRRFESRDTSTNNFLVSLVAFGEGWHNNHHAHPRSARHGLTWKEFDQNWIQIKILEKLGLASNIYEYKLKKTDQKTT